MNEEMWSYDIIDCQDSVFQVYHVSLTLAMLNRWRYHALLILSQSDYLIQDVDTKSHKQINSVDPAPDQLASS